MYFPLTKISKPILRLCSSHNIDFVFSANLFCFVYNTFVWGGSSRCALFLLFAQLPEECATRPKLERHPRNNLTRFIKTWSTQTSHLTLHPLPYTPVCLHIHNSANFMHLLARYLSSVPIQFRPVRIPLLQQCCRQDYLKNYIPLGYLGASRQL